MKNILALGVIALIAILGYSVFTTLLLDCTISAEDVLKAEQEGYGGDMQGMVNSLKETIYFGIDDGIFACDVENPKFLDKTKFLVTDTLGFQENFYDFLYPSLVAGLLAGLWIWMVYKFALTSALFNIFRIIRKREAGLKRNPDIASLKSSWLGFIGSSVWKIIPIAIAYAVLMQIPILNRLIQIITLQPLLFYKGFWGEIALRSIIIAFYIGFLPAGIEEYMKYKLRKKYYSKILRAKYRARGMDAVLSK